MTDVEHKALSEIAALTDGYSEFGVPVAYWANCIARRALGLHVAVHNHKSEQMRSDCERCDEIRAEINRVTQ